MKDVNQLNPFHTALMVTLCWQVIINLDMLGISMWIPGIWNMHLNY